jgi:mono/diheme cytochrome c family protein
LRHLLSLSLCALDTPFGCAYFSFHAVALVDLHQNGFLMKGSVMKTRLLLAMIVAGSNSACMAATPPDGQSVFSQRCSKCHTVQKLAPIIKKEPVAGREAYLSKFLERHYPPPAADRAMLIDYLLKQAAN